jgi:hypothetical protein
MTKQGNVPNIGDFIEVDWPGSGKKVFSVSDIRSDVDSVKCVVFGKDGIVGAEALEDFVLDNSVWRMKKEFFGTECR